MARDYGFKIMKGNVNKDRNSLKLECDVEVLAKGNVIDSHVWLVLKSHAKDEDVSDEMLRVVQGTIYHYEANVLKYKRNTEKGAEYKTVITETYCISISGTMAEEYANPEKITIKVFDGNSNGHMHAEHYRDMVLNNKITSTME